MDVAHSVVLDSVPEQRSFSEVQYFAAQEDGFSPRRPSEGDAPGDALLTGAG